MFQFSFSLALVWFQFGFSLVSVLARLVLLPDGTPSGRRWSSGSRSASTIYSLPDLREILLGCNRRYLTFLSALDDFSAGARALDQLTTPRVVAGKIVKGINFFSPIEQRLLRALQRPAFNIAGIRPTLFLSSTSSLSI